MIIAPGSTSISIDVQFVDDTGLAVTGLVAATMPTLSWSLAGNTAATTITTSDLAAITTAWTSSGVKERSGGYYRLDIPNAALAAAGNVRLIGEAAGKHLICEAIVVANLPANVLQWNSTNVASPATAGIPDINVKNIVNVAAALDGNNLLKVDVEDWKGGVVPAVTVTGVPKVDVVDWLGSAPNALVSGRVDCSAGALAANVITAGSINASAMNGKGDWMASYTQPTGFLAATFPGGTIANTTNITTATGITVATNNDKTAYRLIYEIRNGTAQAGAAGSITLDAGASATDNLYRDESVEITGGTGVGQSRLVTGYTGSSKVATVAPNWITNPDNTSVFAVLPTNKVSGVTLVDSLTNAPTAGDLTATMKTSAQTAADAAITANATIIEIEAETDGIAAISTSTPLTAAQIATGVWQDTTAGDFTAANSIGKSLSPATLGTVPGAAGGLFIAGTNAATAITTGLTAHIIGTVDTLTTYTGNTPQTGDVYALANSGTSGFVAINADVEELITTIGVAGAGLTAITGVTLAASQHVIVDSGTVTNLTNAPTAGDLTAAMKTSVQTAADAAITANVTIIDIEVDTGTVIPGLLPAALSSNGNIKADIEEIAGNTGGAARLDRSARAIVLGTCAAGSTTTVIATSSLVPTASVADQYFGRIVIFDKDTATVALRGQPSNITANDTSGNLTVVSLTTAPASGDTFTIT